MSMVQGLNKQDGRHFTERESRETKWPTHHRNGNKMVNIPVKGKQDGRPLRGRGTRRPTSQRRKSKMADVSAKREQECSLCQCRPEVSVPGEVAILDENHVIC